MKVSKRETEGRGNRFKYSFQVRQIIELRREEERRSLAASSFSEVHISNLSFFLPHSFHPQVKEHCLVQIRESIFYPICIDHVATSPSNVRRSFSTLVGDWKCPN